LRTKVKDANDLETQPALIAKIANQYITTAENVRRIGKDTKRTVSKMLHSFFAG
jgi:3-methyladenine DNA glycosylase AlkC